MQGAGAEEEEERNVDGSHRVATPAEYEPAHRTNDNKRDDHGSCALRQRTRAEEQEGEQEEEEAKEEEAEGGEGEEEATRALSAASYGYGFLPSFLNSTVLVRCSCASKAEKRSVGV